MKEQRNERFFFFLSEHYFNKTLSKEARGNEFSWYVIYLSYLSKSRVKEKEESKSVLCFLWYCAEPFMKVIKMYFRRHLCTSIICNISVSSWSSATKCHFLHLRHSITVSLALHPVAHIRKYSELQTDYGLSHTNQTLLYCRTLCSFSELSDVCNMWDFDIKHPFLLRGKGNGSFT